MNGSARLEADAQYRAERGGGGSSSLVKGRLQYTSTIPVWFCARRVRADVFMSTHPETDERDERSVFGKLLTKSSLSAPSVSKLCASVECPLLYDQSYGGFAWSRMGHQVGWGINSGDRLTHQQYYRGNRSPRPNSSDDRGGPVYKHISA
jgi:hypothetical protein